jgi:hypothetical protein
MIALRLAPTGGRFSYRLGFSLAAKARAMRQAAPGRRSEPQPRRAFSIAATSIFVIVIIASKARLAAARSGLV